MLRIVLSCLAVAASASHSLGVEPPRAKVTVLAPGNTIKAGEYQSSPNGRHSLHMQSDGNLVWYCDGKPAWSTGTTGQKDVSCTLQDDGNLVLYGTRDGRRSPVWASNTTDHKGAILACQDDGNVVMYAKSVLVEGKYYPVWSKDGKIDSDDLVKTSDLFIPLASFRVARRASDNINKLVTLEIVPDVRVSFDDEVIDKVVQREPYETIKGVKRSFTVKRSYETAITETKTVGVEAGVGVTLGVPSVASVSADAKAKIESSLAITLSKSHSVEETFTLGESDVTKVNIIWVERYRKGRIKQGDSTVDVLVTIGMRLKIEKAE